MKNELESFKEILQLKRYSKQTIDSYLSYLKLSQVFFENKSFVSIKEKDWLNPPIRIVRRLSIINKQYFRVLFLKVNIKFENDRSFRKP